MRLSLLQITRDRIRSKGRLVSKLTTDESSSNPRWLVAFDEKSWPEEDMYESAFGKIIGKVSDVNLQHIQPRHNSNGTKSTTTSSTRKPSSQPPPTSSGGTPAGSQASQPRQKKKTEVSRSPSPPQQVSEASNGHEEVVSPPPPNNNHKKRKLTDTEEEGKSDDSAARKKAQDREARRKRRQAVVEEEEVKMGAHNQNVKKKSKDSEDVIRVPMLTGTLLLYRGPQRRAEFIYKK